MWRGPGRQAGILLLAVIALGAGCTAGSPRNIEQRSRTNLLLGYDRSARLATRIGRVDWPTTEGRFEGPEDTVYLEYYRDYQGSEFQERSNPRRLFRSYRIGTQYR